MYDVHDWAEVRSLRREGLSKKHIAERLGMSRTTVYRLLALEEQPRYLRQKVPSLLDGHLHSIRGLLREDPTAPATVILEHLRPEGYRGGITILRELLRELRPQFAPPPEPFGRTVYLPGEICQLDWWDVPGDVRVPVGKGHSRPAFGLVGTLPYSAVHAVAFTHSKTAADVTLALPGVFARLGGLPASVVVDRDSTMVNRHTRRLLPDMAALLGALAVRPIVLPPYRPTSKGSVERMNGYLETSFLPLRNFASLSDLQHQHDEWARDTAWKRRHRRVGSPGPRWPTGPSAPPWARSPLCGRTLRPRSTPG